MSNQRRQQRKKLNKQLKILEQIKALKLPEESFSETVTRLKNAKGSIKECFGLWKLSVQEEQTMHRAINQGKQETTL